MIKQGEVIGKYFAWKINEKDGDFAVASVMCRAENYTMFIIFNTEKNGVIIRNYEKVTFGTELDYGINERMAYFVFRHNMLLRISDFIIKLRISSENRRKTETEQPEKISLIEKRRAELAASGIDPCSVAAKYRNHFLLSARNI